MTTTVGEALRCAIADLRAGGVETPDLDARALASATFGLSAARLIAGGEAAAPEALARLRDFVGRRLGGEPVARILGRREFWGLDFELAPDTLAPRPDTETVVEAALALVGRNRPGFRVLDLGTGSGCILLALLSELTDARGVGVDLSPGAAETARANARRLGLEDRALFVVGRWGAAFGGRFDLVVSNPPYIETAAIDGLDVEVRAHDPRLALDGGADGLDAYRQIAAQLTGLLAPGGAAVLELGAGQLAAVSAIAKRAGLVAVGATADLGGVPRALALKSSSPNCER